MQELQKGAHCMELRNIRWILCVSSLRMFMVSSSTGSLPSRDGLKRVRPLAARNEQHWLPKAELPLNTDGFRALLPAS